MIGHVEPALLWQPWVGHWFPGVTPSVMRELTIEQFVEMRRFYEAATKRR